MLVLALVAAGNILTLLMPWPLKIVVDHVLWQQPIPAWLAARLPAALAAEGALLAAAVVTAVLLEIGAAALGFAENYVSIDAGQRMVNDLRADLYAHL